MDGVVGVYLATNMRGIRWCLSINLIKTISLLALNFIWIILKLTSKDGLHNVCSLLKNI